MTMYAPPVARQRNSVQADVIDPATVATGTGRLAAYAELAKPRIALMVLLAVAVGFVLGSRDVWQPVTLLNACIGVLLAVVSSSAFNQYVERNTDARMDRTKDRPLPSHRLSPGEVFWFATLCGACSFVYLLVAVNAVTAWLTLATIVMYSACYTPLKRYTSLCTVVGAVPGALPPVLGWTAAGADLNAAAFSLFAILFVWQFPHFLAIAWIYQDQYQQAGLKMVPAPGRAGIVGAISVSYALVLIPVSMLPTQLDLSGQWYAITALVLGLAYAWAAICFQREESRVRARRLLWVSLIYLPCVLLALTLDHVRLLN